MSPRPRPHAAVVVAPTPTFDVRGVDRAALTTAAATAVAGGPITTAALSAGPCDLRCRLDAAKSAGARLAVLIDTGTLADATQVGVVLVDLQTGRAVVQHAERVATDKAPAADARGLRAASGKPLVNDGDGCEDPQSRPRLRSMLVFSRFNP